MDDGGWSESAEAFIGLIDAGAPERALLLDPVMLRLCGDVGGRRVLDNGCGEGRFSRMLAAAGADVVALDRTAVMVRAARERRCGVEQVVRGTGDGLPFRDASFDLVVSYIVLVDIPDFRAAVGEMSRVLRPGGRAVVANLSFMSVNTGWVRDEAGRRLYYPMDNYLEERPITLEWAGVRITNWHRPLSAYMAAFVGAGFRLVEFLEPTPADDSLRNDPRFEDWYRLPNFVVMAWEKE
jgi:SAM-dependent methyltransferase